MNSLGLPVEWISYLKWEKLNYGNFSDSEGRINWSMHHVHMCLWARVAPEMQAFIDKQEEEERILARG